MRASGPLKEGRGADGLLVELAAPAWLSCLTLEGLALGMAAIWISIVSRGYRKSSQLWMLRLAEDALSGLTHNGPAVL